MAEDRRLLKVLKILDSKIQCNLDLGKESERDREREREGMNYIHLGCHMQQIHPSTSLLQKLLQIYL